MNYINNYWNAWKSYGLLAGILAIVLITPGCSKQKPEVEQKEYNFIFISIDALRADHLGCYGYQRDTSPHIDQFAKDNILFENFFTVVPKTGPSMTSFFTGRYIQHHGVTTNSLRRDEAVPTITEILPRHFKKIAIVANLGLNKERGYADGFDEYTNLKAGAIKMEDQSQAELTPQAISWLKENGQKGKFFLWLHYLDPHGPLTPPPEYKEMFVGDQYYDPSRKIGLDYVSQDSSNENNVLGAVPKYQRLGDHNEVDYYVAQYDAEIRYTDAELKKLFDYLKASQLWDSTIIVLTADHGEGMGENNYYFEHGRFVDDGQIHIPLVIRHPDVKKPLVVDSLLQSTDLGPTILSSYGLGFPGPVDGVDFSKLYLNGKPSLEIHDYVYSCTPHEYEEFREAVRTKTGKMVRVDEASYQYFDLANDRLEKDDIFGALPGGEKAAKLDILNKFGRKTIVSAKDVKLPAQTIKSLKTLGYTK